MNNTELKRNGEGYADPTPAGAMAKPEPGDVYANGDKMALVLKNHGPFSTILLLTEKDYPRNIKLHTKQGARWVDPRLATFSWHDKIGKYAETLPPEDIAIVTTAVEEALHLHLLKDTPDENLPGIDRMRRQIEEYHAEVQKLTATLDVAERARANAEFEAIKARNQLDLLRGMYDDLLNKALGGSNLWKQGSQLRKGSTRGSSR